MTTKEIDLQKATEDVQVRLREVAFEKHQQQQEDQRLDDAAKKLVPQLDRLLNELIQFDRYEDAEAQASNIHQTLTKETKRALWLIYQREENLMERWCWFCSIITCCLSHCYNSWCTNRTTFHDYDSCTAASTNRRMIIIQRLSGDQHCPYRIYW
jgi:hypothetical protein